LALEDEIAFALQNRMDESFCFVASGYFAVNWLIV